MLNPPRSGLLGDPKMAGGSTGGAVSGEKKLNSSILYFPRPVPDKHNFSINITKTALLPTNFTPPHNKSCLVCIWVETPKKEDLGSGVPKGAN